MLKRTTSFSEAIIKTSAIPAILLFALSTAANADLCVLKNGDYTLSSKYSLSSPTNFTTGTETASPCSDADAADGASDDSIDLEFFVGEDINVDIVYEQDSVNQYRAEFFEYALFYDTANMTIGDAASGDCNPDPAGFFSDDMGTLMGVPVCGDGTGEDEVTPAVVNLFMNFSSDDYPADGANFVLDQLRFSNGYSTGEDLYAFTFEETGALRTDICVFVGPDRCGIFSGAEQCASNGVALQDILTSKISMVEPPCYVGPPATASVSCAGDAASCASNPESASADVTLTYSPSSQSCYESSACSTPSTSGSCNGINSSRMGVEFTNLSGEKQYNQSSGTYVETSTVGTTPSYELKGVDLSGTCLSCSTTKTVTAPSACACGDAPEVALSSVTAAPVQGKKISVSYSVSDSDTDLADLESIKFYYTNDINEAATVYTVNVATEVSSAGLLTVKIPEGFVAMGVDVYYGVIVTDDVGLTGSYPVDFAVGTDGKLDAMTSSKIDGSSIAAGTSFAFVSGGEPYPNQFPYLTGADANLLKIYFTLNAQADVTLSIYDLDDALIREITADATGGVDAACSGEACNACEWSSGCRWDGTDSLGAKVANGTYRFVLEADATSAFSGSTVTKEFGFHVYNENETWEYAGITSAELNLTDGMLTIQGAECPYTDQYPVLGYGDPSNSVEYYIYRTIMSGTYSANPNITTTENSYVGYAGGYGAGTYYYNMKCGVNPPNDINSDFADAATYFEDTNSVEASLEIPSINENSVISTSTEIKMGWSIISFPFDNDSGNLIDYISGDFGNDGNVSVFGLTSEGLAHANDLPMEKGKSYWINSLNQGDTVVTVSGKPTMSNEVVEVTDFRTGWNFIGNPFFTNIQWGDNVKIKCGGGDYVAVTSTEAQSFIYSDLYEYNNEDGGSYSAVSFGENMSPWKGYLAYITGSNCSLQMRIE